MGGDAIDAMHLTDVDGPQECLAILDQTFVNPGLLWTCRSSAISTTCYEADLRRPTSTTGGCCGCCSGRAGRWALKWPCHLLALEAIRSVYPDACFVVTHRDPVQALASNCSLAHMLRSSAIHADPRQTGRDMLELVRTHVDRLLEFDRPRGSWRGIGSARRLLPTRRRPGGRNARHLRGHRRRVDPRSTNA